MSDYTPTNDRKMAPERPLSATDRTRKHQALHPDTIDDIETATSSRRKAKDISKKLQLAPGLPPPGAASGSMGKVPDGKQLQLAPGLPPPRATADDDINQDDISPYDPYDLQAGREMTNETFPPATAEMMITPPGAYRVAGRYGHIEHDDTTAYTVTQPSAVVQRPPQPEFLVTARLVDDDSDQPGPDSPSQVCKKRSIMVMFVLVLLVLVGLIVGLIILFTQDRETVPTDPTPAPTTPEPTPVPTPVPTPFPLSGWTQLGQDIVGTGSNDRFGWSIDMSFDGSVVAVGARLNDDNGANSGHVRVFRFDGSTWNQLGQALVGANAGDRFGNSVALSSNGTVVAVGGNKNARVYAFDDTAWDPVGQTLEQANASDEFGSSISLSSDGAIVAVGAKHNDDNGEDAGHVRVFQYNGTAWNPMGQTLVGEFADANCGASLILSSNGTILAVGAHFSDDNGDRSGQVRVFRFEGAAWNQLGQTLVGEHSGDHFGTVSLSSDGSVLAVGADDNDDNGTGSGHVRVFHLDGTNHWNPLGPKILGEHAGDLFGWSVSLSSDGTVVAVGAYRNNDNGNKSGHVRVFRLVDGMWAQLGSAIPGSENAEYGTSVALSADGTIVAAGGESDPPGYASVYRMEQ